MQKWRRSAENVLEKRGAKYMKKLMESAVCNRRICRKFSNTIASSPAIQPSWSGQTIFFSPSTIKILLCESRMLYSISPSHRYLQSYTLQQLTLTTDTENIIGSRPMRTFITRTSLHQLHPTTLSLYIRKSMMLLEYTEYPGIDFLRIFKDI